MATVKLNPASGKVSGGAHTDFPVLITPSEITNLGSLTLAEAQSCRIYTDASLSTEVAREVVSADEIWAKDPSLDSSTELYFDYDGVRSDYAAGATYGSEAVWSDTHAVWHMNDATTSTVIDSSENSYTLSGSGPTETAGVIGKAQSFSGSNDRLTQTSGVNDNISESVSFWIKTTKTSLQHVLWGSDTTNTTTNSKLRATYLNNSTGSGAFIVLYQVNDTTDRLRADTGDVGIDDGFWHKVRYVVDNPNSNIQFYIDGNSVNRTMVNVNDLTGITTDEFYVGERPNGDGDLDGDLDEIVIRAGTVSADWETTEYNNQSDNGAFWEAEVIVSTRNVLYDLGGMG